MKKFALVTGANRGIGLEVARQLINLGYFVYFGSRDINKGETAIKKNFSDTSSLMLVPLDVTDLQSIKHAVTKIQQHSGHLDVLINNAAIHYDDWENILNVDMKIVREAFETNTLGPRVMIQEFLSLLTSSSSARIVNVSSEAGATSCLTGQTPAYTLSKYALNAITRMYARDLKKKNILINSVCPGWTNTDMGKGGRAIPEGAKSVVWAATLPDSGPTGEFFRDGKKLSF